MKRLTPALMLLAVAGPAVAHEGHGEPGLLHGFGGEHGIALLAAIGLMVAGVALARPVMRLIARRRSRR